MCYPGVLYRKSVGCNWHPFVVSWHIKRTPAALMWYFHLVSTGTCGSGQVKCRWASISKIKANTLTLSGEKKRWMTSDQKGWSRKLHAEGILEVKNRKIPQATKCGDTTKADHKVLNEDNESPLHHHHAVVVQNSATRWMQSYPCRNKAAQETMRNVQRFLPQESNPGATYADGSVEFTEECEALSWNHEKSEPHRSDTNGIAQRTARRIKEGTSTVFSPIKMDEQRWGEVMECYFFFTKKSVIIYEEKEDTTHHSVGPWYLLDQRYSIIQFPLKTRTDFIN